MTESILPSQLFAQSGPRHTTMIKELVPRCYQETIFSTCAEKNTLVVLPTGLGKTVIALLLCAQRLSLFPKSKVLFLAPTKPLVAQHYETFKRHCELPESDFAFFTGDVRPDKRAALWQDSKVIFSTPQGLENDIIGSTIKLEDVSLLIFDEAHRATADYAYTFIAQHYSKRARYPRILALTASPGSDLEKITEVCRNLSIEDVEMRADTDPDVKPYVQDTHITWRNVILPDEFKKIQSLLKLSFKNKIADLRARGYADSRTLIESKTDVLKLQRELQFHIAQGDKNPNILKSISLLSECIKLQHALELLESQCITALHKYLQKLCDEAQTTNVKALQNLVRDEQFKSVSLLTRILYDAGIEHPKFNELRAIISKEIENNPESKTIIFTQFRDTAQRIILELFNVDGAKATLFVGQTKKGGTGMNQKQQKLILDEFKQGTYNCLIATSVAEEGLDIPKVDLVIFYEPVPSGIRTIQRRGRTGRSASGNVVVLVTKDTRDEGYRWSAHHKEKRMHRTLASLKHCFTGVANKKEASTQQQCLWPELSLKIFVDHREKSSGIPKELLELGVELKLETLEVGDYIVSKRVGVEYKTVPDFVDSIIDGRLLNQLREMKQRFERPLVVVEGEEDIYTQRNIHPNAIRGMIATITVSYGIPVIMTKNCKETAALLAIIAKREQEAEQSDFNPHANRKPMSTAELQEYITSALPGVGSGLAKPLLEKLGSVKNIVNATEEELKSVDKIGEKKAKEIRRVLDSPYQNGTPQRQN
ncbi:DEAD/DEAH box helicase family protein [Candidatus Woesearchaeota archaeon]|nr:DEAD/DEAH box helicase family protein [Candidatus Woesearchaeota archaeon]